MNNITPWFNRSEREGQGSYIHYKKLPSQCSCFIYHRIYCISFPIIRDLVRFVITLVTIFGTLLELAHFINWQDLCSPNSNIRALNTTNCCYEHNKSTHYSTVLILCFLFVFSFLSWHCMENIPMEMITVAK